MVELEKVQLVDEMASMSMKKHSICQYDQLDNGAKADTVLKAAFGIRINDGSEIKTSGSQNLQGRSANTAANLSTQVYRSHGISIDESTLESTNGLINLEGTGASGNQVKRAYGIYLKNESSVRAAAINLTGNGGKASDLNINKEPNSYNFYGNSYNNAGITLENQASLDSNPSNDNGSPINHFQKKIMVLFP